MRGIKNEIVDAASEHVQANARYHKDSPKRCYSVVYGTKVFTSDDTWDLVEQLARYLSRRSREN